ncbi:erythromycin esterase family protein [Sphingomonas sp. MMS24-JH45]
MAQNLTAMLRPGDRAAFWAHDMHVVAAVDAAFAAQGALTIGAELRKALGDRYRTVGFTYSRPGADAARRQRLAGFHRDQGRRPGRTGERSPAGSRIGLRAIARRRLVDRPRHPARIARGCALARPADVARMGRVDRRPDEFQPYDANDTPSPVRQGFDVLVWFRALTPQHRWPVARPRPQAVGARA